MSGNTVGFIVARLIAAGLLFWALDRHPYGYYTLLRWVVCGVAAYAATQALGMNKLSWVWTFGIVAVLFNPLVPVHLNRELWAVIDVGVAILMLLSLHTLAKHETQPPGGTPPVAPGRRI
jgi:hypothetical protein